MLDNFPISSSSKPDVWNGHGWDNWDLAVTYALNGYKVFPCSENKTPIIKGGHGWHDATDDIEQIYHWWGKKYPGAIVGIAAQLSGKMILDLDRHEGQADGVEAFVKLVKKFQPNWVHHGPLQHTPGGGMHLIFDLPLLAKGYVLPKQLAPGIDLIHFGSVCSGVFSDGRGYSWEYGHGPQVETMPPPLFIKKIVDALQPQKVMERPVMVRLGNAGSRGIRPGDEFSRRTDWAEILEPKGWRSRDGKYWTRPGGVRTSAGITKDGNLYVFSTNAQPFEEGQSYSKLMAFSMLQGYGREKLSAAVAELKREGYVGKS